ncbi:MAG: cytochrome c7 [Geobacteraceae bacterium]
MKKIIVAMALTLICAVAAMAAGPETITLPAKNGNITFHHKQHQEKLKECKLCHEKAPGKIEGLGKDWAHKTCKGCHEEKKAGPTKCGDCHKK